MARRRRNTATLPKAARIYLTAPQVVALRSLRTHDQLEMQRMGTEKILAFWESMNAMGVQVARANQEYALFAMRQWWWPWMTPWQMASAAGKIMDKGLGPINKRVAANARRLRR
jgi:hypothetical protein